METTKKSIFSGNLRQMGMIIALVIITLGFGIATEGTLFRPMNVSNIFMQNSFEIILAIGMFFCMLTGGNVDLSVGSIVGLAGAIMAVLTLNFHLPTSVAVIITITAGLLVGVVQGSFIAFLNVPPCIMYLGCSRDTYKPSDLLLYISCLIGDNRFIRLRGWSFPP